jgi:hypothetical protein
LLYSGMFDAFRIVTNQINHMKPNTVSNKLALVSVAVCVLMLAFSHNAGAAPQVMPPDIVSVPDGGTTIMLLGTALVALGMARRFLKI